MGLITVYKEFATKAIYNMECNLVNGKYIKIYLYLYKNSFFIYINLYIIILLL